jgi:hypothetical protein
MRTAEVRIMGDGRQIAAQMGEEQKIQLNHLTAFMFLLLLPPNAG